MGLRTLLLVTYHFPPSAAVAVYRMLGLARHLPKFGWRVCVVAPPRMPDEPVDEALARQIPPETAVYPTPFPQHWLDRQVRRFVSTGVWVPRALARCAEVIRRERPDAVMTSSPPHCVHWVGLLLKQRRRLPWLASFRDPWVTNNSAFRPWSLSWGVRAAAERLFVAHADRLVVNTPLGRDGFHRAYPEYRHKITAVTNGYDPESFGPPADVPPPRDRLTLVHAGELYSGRDPRPLLDALARLERERPPDAPAVGLRLLGQSTENRFDLRAAIHERGLDGLVELPGQVPYADALDAMKRADVLLLLDTAGRRVSIPAKLYEYFGARRPILALAEADGDIAWALRTNGGRYHLVPPRDADAVQRALVELRRDLCAGAYARSANGRPAVFTREQMARQIAAQLELCLRPACRPAAAPTPATIPHENPHHEPAPLRRDPDPDRPRYARA